MIYLKRFVLMLQFFTTIPVNINIKAQQKDFGKGLVFAPQIGILIGCMLATAYYILNKVFPIQVTAIFITVIYIVITGGLHLDGLGDTFDGLFSNRPRDRILEIMRDSRLGTNAVLAIICIILINIGMLTIIDTKQMIFVLILLPAAGRTGSLIGSGVSLYARNGEGLGKSFIEHCGIKEVLIGVALYLGMCYLIWNVRGLIAGGFSVLTALILTWLLSRKINGVTGDILGAVCELNQILFLVGAYLLS